MHKIKCPERIAEMISFSFACIILVSNLYISFDLNDKSATVAVRSPRFICSVSYIASRVYLDAETITVF